MLLLTTRAMYTPRRDTHSDMTLGAPSQCAKLRVIAAGPMETAMLLYKEKFHPFSADHTQYCAAHRPRDNRTGYILEGL